MIAKKKMGKTKTKPKELTKAQLAKLLIKELRKHGLQPMPSGSIEGQRKLKLSSLFFFKLPDCLC